jgi:hypothetical protein
VKATVSDATIKPTVNIKGDSLGAVKIIGRNMEIRSKIGSLYIYAYAYSSGKALGVDVYSESYVQTRIDVATYLQNAEIRGYDSINLLADARPAKGKDGKNIYLHAYAYGGGIGSVVSVVDYGSSHANVVLNVNGGAVFYGANVYIDAKTFNGNVVRDPETKFQGIGSSKEKRYGSFSYGRALTVAGGTSFYIGDAAAGIVMDFSKKQFDKTGSYVRQVGVKNDQVITSVSDARRTISVAAISNNMRGVLSIGALTAASQINVFDQAYIPYILLINRTDYDLEISSMTVRNSNFVNPQLSLVNCTANLQPMSDPYSLITIESWGSGDVVIMAGSLIANYTGTTRFVWRLMEGETIAAGTRNLRSSGMYRMDTGASAAQEGQGIPVFLDTAPLWTHSLIVENAGSLGVSSDNRFTAFLFSLGSSAGTIAVQAAFNSFTSFTPIEPHVVEGTLSPENATDKTVDQGLRIDRLLAGGTNDILLNDGWCMYLLKGGVTAAIPLPGSLSYIIGIARDLSTNATLDAAAMARYLTSTIVGDGSVINVYTLPNSTVIFTDGMTGEILRIIEEYAGNTVDFTASAYEISDDKSTVKLAEGVIIDLSRGGELVIYEGVVFETLLSVIDATWLANNLYKQSDSSYNYKFAFVFAQYNSATGQYNTVETKLFKWFSTYSNSTTSYSEYYYLQAEGNPTLSAGNKIIEIAFVYASGAFTNTLSVHELTNGIDQSGSANDSIKTINPPIYNTFVSGYGDDDVHFYWYDLGDFSSGFVMDRYSFVNRSYSTVVSGFGGTNLMPRSIFTIPIIMPVSIP